MKNKPQTRTIPLAIQKIFIVAAFASFFVQIALQIYAVTVQYPNNQNLSSFYWMFIYTAAVPIFAYAIAHILNPRKSLTIANVFENMVLTVSTVFVYSLLMTVTAQCLSRFMGSLNNSWIVMEIGVAVVALVWHISFLIYLKRSKRWQ